MDIRNFLEESERLHFYGLLGGLADNLLSLGNFAGTFLSCERCGRTYTLKDSSWNCECCGNHFELHFAKMQSGSKDASEATVKVKGVRKPKLNPHWYYQDENWSVAEFVHIISHLPGETFLARFAALLGTGVATDDSVQNLLCWPRLVFGNRTVQPDVIIEFAKSLIAFEFKRPEGALVPPEEIASQLIFMRATASKLCKDWRIVIVPGPDAAPNAALELAIAVPASLDAVKEKRDLSEVIVGPVRRMTTEEIADKLVVVTWPEILSRTENLIQSLDAFPWTRQRVLDKLRHFRKIRFGLNA